MNESTRAMKPALLKALKGRAGFFLLTAILTVVPAYAADKPTTPPSKDEKKEEIKSEVPAASDNKVFLDAWSYARERKTKTGSNRVTARFTVKNVTNKNLDDVSASLVFLSGTGEKVWDKSLTMKFGAIKPGETKQFEAWGEFIPVFGGYEIAITYSGGKEKWLSPSDLDQPQPGFDKPLENMAQVVLLGTEAGPDRTNRLSGEVRVRNAGTAEAKNCKLEATYYANPPAEPPPDKGKKPVQAAGGPTAKGSIGTETIKLGTGSLKGGEEKVIKFQFAKQVIFKYFTLKATCDDTALETQLSGGDFTKVKDLEAAHWNFKRSGVKEADLDVSVDLRNGLESAIGDIKLTMNFATVDPKTNKPTTVKTHVEKIAGPIEAGKIQKVAFTIANMSKYDSFEQGFEFGAAGGNSAESTEKKDPPKFQNTDAVEVLIMDVVKGNKGNAVKVVGMIRNGKTNPVKDLQVTVDFLKADGSILKTGEISIDETLATGEVKDFEFSVGGAKDYSRSTSKVAYKELKP